MSFGIESLLGLLAIVVPFVATFVLLLLPQRWAKWVCISGAALSSLLVVLVAWTFATGGAQTAVVPVLSLGGVQVLGFVFDKVSTLLACAFVVIGLLVSIYSVAYMSPDNREHPDAPRRRFYAYLSIFIGAMAGVVYASTLIGMLVFFEITGACSWGLIGYYHTPTATKAAMKAMIITHIGSLGLVLAAIMTFALAGTFETTAIAGLADGPKTVVLLGILFAAWAKSAQWPLYMWLPSAMEAPTPVSAYLHGASMVKVGVSVFARALLCAGTIPLAVGWTAAVGALVTMLFGFLMYLPQTDMKRLLAFSTIAQLAYIFMGLGIAAIASAQTGAGAAASLAFTGAVSHIFNHAWAKTLFFLVAGSLSFTLGTRMLPKIRGLLRAYPVTGVAFAFAALAIAGVPPMNCFFSKFQIFAGGFEAGMANPLLLAFVVIMILETVATFAWFLHWMGQCLMGEPSETVSAGQPLPAAMAGVFVVLMVMVVVSGPLSATWLG